MKNERLKKLPKWAQDEIAALRQRIFQLEMSINADNKHTNVYAIIGVDEKKYLFSNYTVGFETIHDHIFVNLMPNREGIAIRGYREGITIHPQASNSIQIFSQGR